MDYLSDNPWSVKRSEEYLGENPKGFPTQRVALEEEGQLAITKTSQLLPDRLGENLLFSFWHWRRESERKRLG